MSDTPDPGSSPAMIPMFSGEPMHPWFCQLAALSPSTPMAASSIPFDWENGVPVALPATYAVYSSQSSATRDPLSIFLFPSFVLWRVGTLIAAPIDAVEWGVWRWWQPDETLTPEDRERIERELDELQMQWTDYPVEWVYPRAPRG